MIAHEHDFLADDHQISSNQRKTTIVVVLTTIMMVVEIAAGYLTGSMALLADGWHMASHAGALSIALIAYRLAKSETMKKHFSFGPGKFIPLGGYTSAVALAIVAFLMIIESFFRLINPTDIQFSEAIAVAVVGLVVNVASALILSHDHGHGHGHDHHHGHGHEHHHDHNLRSAYIHVIADALTSVLAIIALTIGLFYNTIWLDPLMGIVGAVVILKWAYNLCKETGWELLDGHSKSIDHQKITQLIKDNDAHVLDFHSWKIAPGANACILSVETAERRGSIFYHDLVKENFHIHHLTIEEHVR
jgi:cation diffusion facilitator family transporter